MAENNVEIPVYIKYMGLKSLFSKEKYPYIIAIYVGIFTILYVLVTSILFNKWFKDSVVNFHIGNFYPYFLILSALIFIFATILLYQSLKRQYSSLSILILSLYFGALSYLFGFLNWDPTSSNYAQTDFYQLQVLLSTISIFMLYLHYELNSRNVPRTWLISTIIFLMTPHSILNLYFIFTDNYSENIQGFNIFSVLLLQIGATIVFLIIIQVGISSSRFLFQISRKARIFSGLQLAGLFGFVVNVILEIIETVFPINIFNTPIVVLSLLFIAIPYYLDPNVLIFIPINVYLFGIIDETGITRYYKPLTQEFKETDENATAQLFGGLTIAFKSFGEEVAHAKSGIDSLNFGDRSVIVEYEAPYYMVLIANRSTFFLQKEMEEYLKELKKLYPEVIPGQVIPESVFNDLNNKFFQVIINS